MTYDEITLFRRFLTDKGTLNNFEYFYAKRILNACDDVIERLKIKDE